MAVTWFTKRLLLISDYPYCELSVCVCVCVCADSGIGLESGVFVAGITPGSPAAKDSSLTPGDRLLAVSIVFSYSCDRETSQNMNHSPPAALVELCCHLLARTFTLQSRCPQIALVLLWR